jgi:hypothetical protein
MAQTRVLESEMVGEVLFAPHPLNNNAYSANGTSVLRGSKGFMVAVCESKQRADS